MSKAMTVVVDYGAGNLKSVENALRHLGARLQGHQPSLRIFEMRRR